MLDFLFDHALGKRGFAEFRLIENVSFRILGHDVKFAVGFGDRIIIVVLSDFFKGSLICRSVLPDQVLFADAFEEVRHIVGLEIVFDVASIKYFGIHDAQL